METSEAFFMYRMYGMTRRHGWRGAAPWMARSGVVQSLRFRFKLVDAVSRVVTITSCLDSANEWRFGFVQYHKLYKASLSGEI